jgi:hypothetical protein
MEQVIKVILRGSIVILLLAIMLAVGRNEMSPAYIAPLIIGLAGVGLIIVGGFNSEVQLL